jgi:antagonist of KipI
VLEILTPGMLCTVQDTGRFGYQHLGVGPAGPMDWVSARLANLAVGNDLEQPVLEFSGAMGAFRVTRDALVCRVGGDLESDGQRLPSCRPVAVRANSTIKLDGQPFFRSYLAVAGGVEAPRVLGSASTSTVALLDTFEERGLAKGTMLRVGTASVWAARWQQYLLEAQRPYPQWAVRSPLDTIGGKTCCVRVIRDMRKHCDDNSWRRFMANAFRISMQSNRMGFRLEGPKLAPGRTDILSHGVVTGTVQLPPGGQPIILMADRQTTGGYPVLGHVASVDLPLLAACSPGASVTFREISVEAAQAELAGLHVALERRRHAIGSTKPGNRWF